MVQPNQPGINVPANYWNASTAAMDAEKKKYRSIPVPAILNPKQKHIDDETRLRELVEYISTLEDFEDFDMRKLQGLSPEGVTDQVSVWADEVNAAPEVKRESAQRSFGGHLEDFGAAIGRGLLGGVNKIIGAPGISHTLSALSAPGEEVTAQILYNIARIIPEEQDIERGVKKWREENPDAPWWKRHTLTSAVRQEGFGVPMGVHLPMEIIFDPINLIPVGAAFKLAKPTATMLKLMGKGKSSKEAFRLTRRLGRLQKEFARREALLVDEAAETYNVWDDTDFDSADYGWDPTMGKRRPAAQRHKTGPEGGEWVDDSIDEAAELDRTIEGLTWPGGVKPNQTYKLPQNVKNLLDIKELDEWDITPGGGLPTANVRGKPLHGSVDAPDGLYAIVHDTDAWKALGEDGIKAQWALQLMWYTGIRPHEIPYIKWGDILGMLNETGDYEKILTLTMKETGARSAKTSQRLLDDDAVEFLRRYRDQFRKTDNVEDAGFELPRPLKAKEGEVVDSISGLNKMFEGMARSEAHSSYGEDLLRFYANKEGTGGNFSYVFRLSKANDFYQNTKQIAGVTKLMRMMGHGSTAHTSRYVSLFQHQLSTTMDDLLKEFGVLTDDVLEAAAKDLNEGAWREGLEDSDKLGELGVYSVVNRSAMNRKGFSDADRNTAIQELRNRRYDVLKASINKETVESREFIFPGLGRQATKAAVTEAFAGLAQLQTLTFNIAQSVVEKNIIRSSKEVKGWKSVGGEEGKKLQDLGKRATAEAGEMAEWYEPIMKLADEYLMTLSDATSKVTKNRAAYSKVVDALAMPFKMLVMAELNKLDAVAKTGRGGASSRAPKLSSLKIFDNVLKIGKKHKTTGKPTINAAALRKKLDENPEFAKEMEELSNIGSGYIIHPLEKGVQGPNLKFNRNRTDLWMITGYKTVDGAVFEAGGDVTQISTITVEKLGSKPFRDNMIHRAQREESIEISLLDTDAWALHLDNPFPEHMVRGASHGGKAGLSAEEVAEMLFKFKGSPGINGNARQMAKLLNDEYKVRRLRDNGLIIPIKGTNEYRWSDEVNQAFNIERGDGLKGTQSSEWGYGVMDEGPGSPRQQPGAGEPPKVPPSRPETKTSGDMPEEIPFYNKLWWQDEEGRWRTLGDTIIIPRGMSQIMTFSGQKFAERFNKLPFKMQKFIRMIVPGTFGASDAAKLRWAYIMSKSEGQEVSSNLGHMLDKMHNAFGSNRRNGRGQKITLKAGDRSAIDPKTGMFDDEMEIYKDYYRQEGVIVTPGSSRFNHEVAAAMARPDDNQVLGPIAIMEQKFIEFADKFPEKWGIYVKTEGKIFGGNAIINAERRQFNHLAQMQDMTTFLNTSRGDLARFYDLSTAAGKEQQIWWDKYHQVQPHLLDLLKKAGYDIDNDKTIIGLTTEEIRTSFVPSLFLANDQKLVQGASSLGMKPSQMKARDYHWQIENKMDEGYVDGRIRHDLYNTDPILAIQRTAEAYYDWIAVDRFMDEFAKLGFTTAELHTVDHVAEYVLDYVSKKNTSGSYELTSAQQRMAGKFFGPNWRNMTSPEATARIEKLHSMSAAWRNMNLKEPVTEAPELHRLHDTALPPDASNELRALIQDVFTKSSPFLSGPSTVANMMRVLATGADLGVMLLHGIGGIGMMTSPNIFMSRKQRFAWAQGTWNMGRGMMDPKVRTEWYTRTQLTRRDMQKYGVGFFRSTHIEDLPLPGLFTKGQVRPGLDKPGIKQLSTAMTGAWTVPERMMQGFGYFLDVSKTEMWKAQSGAIRRHFNTVDRVNPSSSNYDNVSPAVRDAEEAALNDLAAGMNATHGTLQPASVGIPQKQRVFESAFLMYAALYKRSAVAMITNLMAGLPSSAMKGGPFTEAGRAAAGARKWRRGPALEAVSGMLLSGAAIGWAIKGMGFNDDIFRPDSPDFMSMKIGGMRLGIGTPYYALTRLAKDIIDQMEDDPSGLGELNFSDNPLLRFFRSGSSPVTAIGIDLAMGQTFIGDPLRDTTGGWEVNKIGTRISRNLQPFWLDSLEDSVLPFGSGDMHPSASLAEFFGLRTSPLSAYGKMKATKNTAILLSENPDIVEWREKTQRAGLPVTGDTIPKLLLDKLIQDTPDLQRLEDELSEDIQRRGSYDRKQQDEYIQQAKLNREGDGSEADGGVKGLNMQLAGLDDKFSAGLLSGREFREAIELLEAEHRGKNQQLAYTYRDIVNGMEERRTLRLNDPIGHFVLDLWYDLYRAHVTSAQDLHDEYGNFNSEMFKARQEWFKDAVDSRFTDPDTGEPYGWKYIEDRRNSKKQLPGSVARLDKARNEQLVDFWSLPDERFSENHAGIIHNWRSQITKEGKAYYQRKNPIVTRLLSRLNTYQDRYRKQNPQVDALLVEFYDYAALTPAGRAVERKRQIAAVTAPVATPAVFTAPTISPLMESFTTENPVLRQLTSRV